MCFFLSPVAASADIYTLSLHDALPIWRAHDADLPHARLAGAAEPDRIVVRVHDPIGRSEEHTSELQSRVDLVCRLLLEKKKRYSSVAQRSVAGPTLSAVMTFGNFAAAQ